MGKSSLNVWWRGMKGFLKPEKLGHWGGSCPGELSFEQGPPVAPRRDYSAWAKAAKVTHRTMGIFGFQPCDTQRYLDPWFVLSLHKLYTAILYICDSKISIGGNFKSRLFQPLLWDTSGFSGCLLLKLLSCRQLSGYGVHFLVEVLGSSGGVSTCIAKAKSSWIGLKEYGYQQDRGCWWSHDFILF